MTKTNSRQITEITFDDILLLPQKSNFSMEYDYKYVDVKTRISKNFTLRTPLIASPMPGVTEDEMAIAFGKAGGVGFIHCFQSFERQLDQVRKVKAAKIPVVAASIVVSLEEEKLLRHVKNLVKAGMDLLSIESAHAENKQTISLLKKIKKAHPGVDVSVSLVVTKEATKALIKAGADSIRVGIGGGSHCTTRLVTGIGRPQLSAVEDCYKITKKHNIPLISDTGIKYAGDIAKAIAFGADAVMIGGMFTGTDEAPGDIIYKGRKKYKQTWGMCTDTAMRQEQLLSTTPLKRLKRTTKTIIKSLLMIGLPEEKKLFEEGVEGLVPYKGSVIPVFEDLIAGLKRSMWYQGFRNIDELKSKARYVIVSGNTPLENIPRI